MKTHVQLSSLLTPPSLPPRTITCMLLLVTEKIRAARTHRVMSTTTYQSVLMRTGGCFRQRDSSQRAPRAQACHPVQSNRKFKPAHSAAKPERLLASDTTLEQPFSRGSVYRSQRATRNPKHWVKRMHNIHFIVNVYQKTNTKQSYT